MPLSTPLWMIAAAFSGDVIVIFSKSAAICSLVPALTVDVVAHPAVAHDVRADAARVHVHRVHPGAAQFLPQRVGEAAHRELRRTVRTLGRHPEQAEDAGGIYDDAAVLLDQNRQEGPGAVDDAVEVDLSKPVVVVRHRIQHG